MNKDFTPLDKKKKKPWRQLMEEKKKTIMEAQEQGNREITYVIRRKSDRRKK